MKDEAKKELLQMVQNGPAQHILPDDKYFEHYEEGKEWVRNNMKDDGDVMMTFFLYGYNLSDKTWAIMPVMFADWPPPDEIDGRPFGKQGVMQGIGVQFADQFPKHMLVNVVHVSEAWMAQQKEDDPEEDKHLMPSQRTDKVECVIVQATSIDQRRSYWCEEIVRDKAGKYKKLKPYLEDKHDPTGESDNKMEDYLTMHLYGGYFMAKEKAGK